MTLSNPWILNLVWLLPVMAMILIIANRRNKKAVARLADPELLLRLTERSLKGRTFFKGVLLLAAILFMIIALAGPRWGSHYQEVSRKGVDIMLLLDVSPSMLVEDIKPTRLERARREIIDLLKVLAGDRIGLIAFSGTAFVQCPLTLDYGAVQFFLSALSPDLIPVPGTDIGSAIETGLSSFDFETETDKILLLITDGEDNEGRGLKAARSAAAKGVKIFVFGVGDTTGGPIPENQKTGGFKKDKEGKIILSKLDEEVLKKIASSTGGVYVRSTTGDLDLDILYFEGVKSRTRAVDLKSGKIKVYEERFTYFLLTALVLLILESLVETRKRNSKSIVR